MSSNKKIGVPENTLAAFTHALESDSDVLEFDVWLTKDNQVVVFHDADLERMTGDNSRVIDCLYAELPPIRIENGLHHGVTAKNHSLAAQIPLLTDVLDLVPVDKPVIIEFKQNDFVSLSPFVLACMQWAAILIYKAHTQKLIRKVHDLIVEQGRKDKVMWFSLSEDINLALRAYDCSIPNINSVAGMLKVSHGLDTCTISMMTRSPTPFSHVSYAVRAPLLHGPASFLSHQGGRLWHSCRQGLCFIFVLVSFASQMSSPSSCKNTQNIRWTTPVFASRRPSKRFQILPAISWHFSWEESHHVLLFPPDCSRTCELEGCQSSSWVLTMRLTFKYVQILMLKYWQLAIKLEY